MPARATHKAKRWEPSAGRCTRAYDEWLLGDRELRAFLKVGLRQSADGYEAAWQRISREPSDGEGPDLSDLMDEEFDGLTSIQFDWLLMNMTVRDGVTLYELYLEKVLEEVAERIGPVTVRERSPDWPRVRKAFGTGLAVDPLPSRAADVVQLRDLLTHRRGELRTETLRAQYDTYEHDFPDLAVQLRPEMVVSHLDALAEAAGQVDRVAFPLAWGRAITAEIRARVVASAPWLFE